MKVKASSSKMDRTLNEMDRTLNENEFKLAKKKKKKTKKEKGQNEDNTGRRMAHNASTLESYSEEVQKTVDAMKKKARKKKQKLAEEDLCKVLNDEIKSLSTKVHSTSPGKKKKQFPPLKFSGNGKALNTNSGNGLQCDPVQVTVTKVTDTASTCEGNEKKKSSKKSGKTKPLTFIRDGSTVDKTPRDIKEAPNVNNVVLDGKSATASPSLQTNVAPHGKKKKRKKDKKQKPVEALVVSEVPVKKKKKEKDEMCEEDAVLHIEKRKNKKKKKNVDDKNTTEENVEVTDLDVCEKEMPVKKKKKKKEKRSKDFECHDVQTVLPANVDSIDISRTESEKSLERPQDLMIGYVFLADSEELSQSTGGDLYAEDSVPVKKKAKKKKKSKEPDETVAEHSLLLDVCEDTMPLTGAKSCVMGLSYDADVSAAAGQHEVAERKKKKQKKDKSRERNKSFSNHSDGKQDVKVEIDETSQLVTDDSESAPRVIGTITMLPESMDYEGNVKKKKRKKSDEVTGQIEELANPVPSSHEFQDSMPKKKKKKSKKRKLSESEDSPTMLDPMESSINDCHSDSLSDINELGSPHKKKKRRSVDLYSDIEMTSDPAELHSLTQRSEEDVAVEKLTVLDDAQSSCQPKLLSTKSKLLKESEKREITRIVTPKKVPRGLRKTLVSENSQNTSKNDEGTILSSKEIASVASAEENAVHHVSPQKALSPSEKLNDSQFKTPGRSPKSFNKTVNSSIYQTPCNAHTQSKRDSTGSSKYGTPTEEPRNPDSGASSSVSPHKKTSKKTPETSKKTPETVKKTYGVRFAEGPRVCSPGSDSDYATPPQDLPELSPVPSTSTQKVASPAPKTPILEIKDDNQPSTSQIHPNQDDLDRGSDIDDLIPPSPMSNGKARRRSLDPIVTGVRKSDRKEIAIKELYLPEPLNNAMKLTEKQLADLDDIHKNELHRLKKNWQQKYTEKGLQLNTCRFEPLEDQQLVYNYKKYFEDNPEALKWQNSWYEDKDNNSIWRKLSIKWDFDLKMSHGILRSKKAVLKRLRVLLRQSSKADLTDRQKKNAIELRQKGLSWDNIAKLMGTQSDKTRMVYEMEMRAQSRQPFNKGPWTSIESQNLTDAIMNVTGTNYETVQGLSQGVNWKDVAEIVGTRSSYQCKRRWTESMGCMPEAVIETAEQKKEFLELLCVLYGNSSNKCNFVEVAPRLSWITSPNRLKQMFGAWKRKVSNYEMKTTSEILQTLTETLIPEFEKLMNQPPKKRAWPKENK